MLAVAICATATTATFAQVQKSLIKSFNLGGVSSVSIDLKGKVTTEKASDDVFKIQTNVNLKNVNQSMYDVLNQKGRYGFKQETLSGQIAISSAPRETVKTSSGEMQEEVSYLVSVPAGINVIDVNGALAAAGRKADKAAKKATKKKKKK